MSLNDFTDTLHCFADLELLARTAKSNADAALYRAQELDGALAHRDLQHVPQTVQNFTFQTLRTGKLISYDFRERHLEEIARDLLRHLNKQLQWVVAEAYEVTEAFVDLCFARCAATEPGFLLARYRSHFTPDEAEHFVELTRLAKDHRKSGDCLQKYRHFGSHFPHLAGLSNGNALHVDLPLVIATAQKIRHVVAHEGGVVESRKRFVQIVTKALGTYNNGNVGQESAAFIGQFVAEKPERSVIYLLEERDQKHSHLHYSRLDQITRPLIAYCHCLHTEIILPRWK